MFFFLLQKMAQITIVLKFNFPPKAYTFFLREETLCSMVKALLL